MKLIIVDDDKIVSLSLKTILEASGDIAVLEIGENGELLSVGKLVFSEPLKVNIFRAYIDNDRNIRNEWRNYENAGQIAYEIKKLDNAVKVVGKMCRNCFVIYFKNKILPPCNLLLFFPAQLSMH